MLVHNKQLLFHLHDMNIKVFYGNYASTALCFTSQAATAKAMSNVAHLSQHHSQDSSQICYCQH